MTPTTLKRACLSLTVTLAAVVAVGRANANPQVYEQTLRGTAWIASKISNDRVMSGSGFLVDQKRRWVVTNWHVVEEREVAYAFFPAFDNGRLMTETNYYKKNIEKVAVAGKVIARDKKRDLALIQLSRLPEGVRELQLAKTSPKPAENLHSIGNSGSSDGVLWRYSKGEVRQVYTGKFPVKLDSGSFELEARVIESQTPTNQGDSGGPVVNDKGEVIGVTQSFDGRYRLISFSIDITEVRAFLKNALRAQAASK